MKWARDAGQSEVGRRGCSYRWSKLERVVKGRSSRGSVVSLPRNFLSCASNGKISIGNRRLSHESEPDQKRTKNPAIFLRWKESRCNYIERKRGTVSWLLTVSLSENGALKISRRSLLSMRNADLERERIIPRYYYLGEKKKEKERMKEIMYGYGCFESKFRNK